MLKGFYYFEGTSKSLDNIKVAFGTSLVSGKICAIGNVYDLEEQDGRILIYKDGQLVGRTGKIVCPAETYITEPVKMPFRRNVGDKECSAQVMIVYTTEHSKYAFIPANTLVEVC